MQSYVLDLRAFGVFFSDDPTLQIFTDGVLNSTHTLSSAESFITTSVTFDDELPVSLSFRFSDFLSEASREIDIQSVRINNRHINIGNFLSLDRLENNQTSTVDIVSAGFIFNTAEPALTEFTIGATRFFTSGNDRLRDFSGTENQIFNLLGGRDTAFLGAGDDKVSGAEGDDLIRAGAGNDLISGGDGNDRLFGQDGADKIFGGAGNDRIQGGNDNDELHGGEGDDQLTGQAGDDNITGGLGTDTLAGGNGQDNLFGDEGDDILIAGGDDDTLDGGSGNDVLYAGLGNDILNGAEGNDILVGGSGVDRLIGGAGEDDLFGGEGDDILVAGQTTIEAQSAGVFTGSDTNTLSGGDGLDVLYASAIRDIFLFEAASAFNDIDIIHGFDLDTDDALDISDLLENYNGNINAYLRFEEGCDGTLVEVDSNGLVGGVNYQTIASLEGVTGLNETFLVLSGNIIV